MSGTMDAITEASDCGDVEGILGSQSGDISGVTSILYKSCTMDPMAKQVLFLFR